MDCDFSFSSLPVNPSVSSRAPHQLAKISHGRRFNALIFLDNYRTGGRGLCRYALPPRINRRSDLFFTANLAERSSRLLFDRIDDLREAVRDVHNEMIERL
jgi:hypothetical protein